MLDKFLLLDKGGAPTSKKLRTKGKSVVTARILHIRKSLVTIRYFLTTFCMFVTLSLLKFLSKQIDVDLKKISIEEILSSLEFNTHPFF